MRLSHLQLKLQHPLSLRFLPNRRHPLLIQSHHSLRLTPYKHSPRLIPYRRNLSLTPPGVYLWPTPHHHKNLWPLPHKPNPSLIPSHHNL